MKKQHKKTIKLTNLEDIKLLDEILADADIIIEEKRKESEALDKLEAEKIIRKQLIHQKYMRKKPVFEIDLPLVIYNLNGDVVYDNVSCRELSTYDGIGMLPSSILQYVKKGGILRDKYILKFKKE